MTDPVELGPHDNMTVEEAITYSSRRNLKEIIILGYDQNGTFVTISSGMSRKDALWLVKLEEDWILERERPSDNA